MQKDKITLDRIKMLHPSLVDEANAIYDEICNVLKGKAICRFTHTLRSLKEQQDLYDQGRTKLFDAKGNRLGIVTNAKPGDSYHNYGLAIDIVLLVDKDGNGTFETASWNNVIDFDGDGIADWMECVNIFKKYGWNWGGQWPKPKTDTPHFEKSKNLPISLLKQKFNNKDFIKGTTFVNI